MKNSVFINKIVPKAQKIGLFQQKSLKMGVFGAEGDNFFQVSNGGGGSGRVLRGGLRRPQANLCFVVY